MKFSLLFDRAWFPMNTCLIKGWRNLALIGSGQRDLVVGRKAKERLKKER